MTAEAGVPCLITPAAQVYSPFELASVRFLLTDPAGTTMNSSAIDDTSVGVAIGRCLESEADLPSFQSLSQYFRSHNTCSGGLTETAANWLDPGYFSQGGKSVVILPNHKQVPSWTITYYSGRTVR